MKGPKMIRLPIHALTVVAATWLAWLTAAESAAADGPAGAAMVAKGIDAGLAVHVGAVDGALEIDLARGGRMLVHALARDEETAHRVRTAIEAEKLYGMVSLAVWTAAPRLPYADNLVNLVVADLDALGKIAPAEAEILRVLSPGRGAAWLRRGGRWGVLRKLMTGGDGWEQYFYDATGNSMSRDTTVKPSTGLQWINGQQEIADDSGYRFSDGKAVYKRVVRKEPLTVRMVCRDAFNGLPYWSRDTAASQQDGLPLLGKLAPLVFTGGRIYTAMSSRDHPLVALDAATGKTLMSYQQAGRTFTHTDAARAKPFRSAGFISGHFGQGDLTYFDGLLIHAAGNELFVVDAATGQRRWHFQAKDHLLLQKPRVNPDDRELYIIGCSKEAERSRGGGRNPGQRASGILAFELAGGKPKWSLPIDNRHITHAVYADRTLVAFSAQDNGPADEEWIFAGIDTTTGKFRWQYPDRRGEGLWRLQRREPIVSGGKLYLLSTGVSAYDLRSGKPLFHYEAGNSRCEPSKATQSYLLSAFSHFVDYRREPPQGMRVGLSRGSCGAGFFPAYGMVHYPPTMCNCDNFIRFHVTASSEPVREPLPDAGRLVRGGADAPGPASAAAALRPRDEWPMFLHGPQRDSWCESRLGEKLRQAWCAPIQSPPPADTLLGADWLDTNDYIGPTSAPVVAGKLAIVAVREQHRIEAVDALSGAKRWAFAVGGRVVTPPTLYGGLCLFGCRDGWVYAVRANDGRLAWKFLAAPYERNIVAFSQIESSWPLLGSLVVHEGLLVAVAGHHPMANGGIHLYGLDPLTGQLKWRRRLERRPEWVDLSQPRNPIDQPHETAVANGGFQANAVLNDLAYGYGPHVRFSGVVLSAADGQSVLPDSKGKRGFNGLYDVSAGPMPLLINAFKTAPYRRHYFTEGYGGPYGSVQAMIVQLPGARVPVQCAGFAYSGHDAVTLHSGKGEQTLRKYDVRKLVDRASLESNETPRWSRSLDGPRGSQTRGQKLYRYASMLVADDTVVVAGRLVGIVAGNDPPPTARDVAPGVLRTYDLRTGEPRRELELDAAPIVSGLAAAYGRLYVACEDGSLRCFE